MSHIEEMAYYVRALDRMSNETLSDSKRFKESMEDLTGFVDTMHYLNGYYHYWNRTCDIPLAYDSQGKQVW